MSRLSLFASLMLVVGCGETTTTPPSQLNLDRPMDLTFACMGGLRIIPDDRVDQNVPDVSDEITISAMPTTACDYRSLPHEQSTPTPVPETQKDLTDQGGIPINPAFWFAFILQSGPGTVAIAQFGTKPSVAFAGGSDVIVLDADPLTPGKNGISIGEDPIAIATDRTGCKVITANAGSCDLSVLDVTTAVDFNPDTEIDVRRLEVTKPSGEPIRARPAAMAAEPQVAEVDIETGLGLDGVIGKKCTGTAQGLLYIAYPSCHVVATVDASNGVMIGGISYASGAPTIMTPAEIDNLQCVDECSGGMAPTPGIRPVTLDLEKDPRTRERRMVVGADNSSSITLVELSETTTLAESVSQIALENTPANDLGITKIALSPQIGVGGEIHLINDENAVGGQMQFVYAITTDKTVRVADVLNIRKECDTQIDPRYLRSINSVRDLSCLPVGEVATPPRRAGARGPGITIPGGEAFPISIDVIKSQQIDGDIRPEEDPTKLIGYFGIIGASNGGVFILNVDDDDRRDLFNTTRPLLTPMPQLISHQIRDGIGRRGDLAEITLNEVTSALCDPVGPEDVSGVVIGGPRTALPPARNVPVGAFAQEKIFGMPGFRQVLCTGIDSTKAVSELSFTAPEPIRDFVYPDLAALRPDETFSVTWEGSLSLDLVDNSIDGPPIRESEIHVDGTGMKIVDQSRPFCSAGVEKFDTVQRRGCDPAFGDVECPIGYRCFIHPNSQVQSLGACMLADEADRLAEACKDFLTSVRRYTVGTTEAGNIQLLPRRHTLRTTPVEGCTDDVQCTALADYALRNASSSHPVDDDTEPDTHTWTCQEDPLLPAVTTGKRCAMRCNATSDCTVGTVCQGGTGGASDFAGFCMEGVVAPQSCVNAPQRYELRAGQAFAVVSSRAGFEHPIIADANGRCVKNPTANSLLVGRIPLTPPACDPAADPFTGRRTDGTFEPNPCSLTIETTDIVPLYEPGTCILQAEESTLAARQANAIRYRSRGLNLTIVDPTYPGDAECILDRAGNLGNIPHLVTNFQLNARVVAGLSPIVVPVAAALPVRVVRGPTNSIWVIDQGDFLSTSISTPSTRGKVFRIEPHALALVNILE